VLVEAHAAAGRPQLAADAAQQRGLAAAGTAHDGHHLAARNLHVDSLQHRSPVIVEMQVFDIDQDVVRQVAFLGKSRRILTDAPANARRRQGYNQTNFIWNVASLSAAKPLLLIVDDDSLITESLSFSFAQTFDVVTSHSRPHCPEPAAPTAPAAATGPGRPRPAALSAPP
jgi:hypothetical protein